jgi:hypothetical protein
MLLRYRYFGWPPGLGCTHIRYRIVSIGDNAIVQCLVTKALGDKTSITCQS